MSSKNPVDHHEEIERRSAVPKRKKSADKVAESDLLFGVPRDFSDCVHCGLCLSSCPTYLELGQEPDSPRGRIHLMKGLAEGRIDLSPGLVRHFDLCLGCRACETACPSGVHYGRLIETTRGWLEENHPRSRRISFLRKWIVGHVMTRPSLFRMAVRGTRLAERLRLPGLARFLLPPGFDPVAWSRRLRLQERESFPRVIPAVPPVRGRVALLTGCVMDGLFRETNLRTAHVLARQGWHVVIPRGQVCCGALLVHNGMMNRARNLAAKNSRSFSLEDVDYVVTNAAGCGAQMKEYGPLLAGRPEVKEGAKLALKTRDVSEILDLHRLRPPLNEIRVRAVYHDACHLAHAQNVTVAPRSLLRQIPGLELVVLPESDVCCGSAGSYNITESEMAARLGRRKAENILSTDPDLVVAGNAGCLVQIEAALEEAAAGRTPRVVHTIDLLDEATRSPES